MCSLRTRRGAPMWCVLLCAVMTSTSSLAPTPSSAPYILFISASVWLVSVSRCGAPRYGNTGVP